MNKDALLCQWDATALPIPPNRFRLMIADFPYAVMTNDDLYRGKKMKAIQRRVDWDEMDKYELMGLVSGAMREGYRVCEDGATSYIFCAHEFLGQLREIGEYNGWYYKMPVFWKKTNPAPKVHLTTYQQSMECAAMFVKGKGNTFTPTNGGLIHNLFTYPIPMGKGRLHPTQKPLELIVQLILNSSHPGDLVLDPCCGSGVTGEAAMVTKRLFVGGDLKYTYVRDMAMWKVHNHASSRAAQDTPLFESVV